MNKESVSRKGNFQLVYDDDIEKFGYVGALVLGRIRRRCDNPRGLCWEGIRGMSNGLGMHRKTVRGHVQKLDKAGVINVDWRDGRAPLVTMNKGGAKKYHPEKEHDEVVHSDTTPGETDTRVVHFDARGGVNGCHDDRVKETANETIKENTPDSSKTLIDAYGGLHFSAAYRWASKRFLNNGKADAYLLELHSKDEFPTMPECMSVGVER